MKKANLLSIFIYLLLFANYITFTYHDILWIHIVQVFFTVMGLLWTSYDYATVINVPKFDFRGLYILPIMWVFREALLMYMSDFYEKYYLLLAVLLLVVWMGLVFVFTKRK